MMLALSAAFGLFCLAGIAFTVTRGSITTVDGLFTTLILLALSGILFLNVFIELRKRKAPTARKTS